MSFVFVRAPEFNKLDEFVSEVADVLGVEGWEKRWSDNYVDGIYFVAEALGSQVKVMYSDESDFESYKFWVVVYSDFVLDGEVKFGPCVAEVVAQLLAARFDVAFVPGVPEGDYRWISYERVDDPSKIVGYKVVSHSHGPDLS